MMSATESTWTHLAVVWTMATILCLCPAEIQGDDACSCASVADGGCVPNQACDPDGNCNKVNVAYGKQASMSSMHYGNLLPACAAVNGRTSGTLSRTTDRNCVHTNVNEQNSHWQVDLGQNFTITDATVYSRDRQLKRLAGLDILVDTQPCKRLPDSQDGINTDGYTVTSTIPCDSPVTGQVVKFYKYQTNIIPDLRIIDFCEVQIWVCRPGLYGHNCDMVCHCLNNATCDNHFGTCPNGCAAGFHGTSCAETCGSCKDDVACHDTTGRCPNGCQPGYQPPLCKTPCENKTYGDNCSLTCGRCSNSAACNVTDGTCLNCENNFKPSLCQSCIQGFHGDECTDRCGQCKDNAACARDTGHCPDGCMAGYQSTDCKTTCQNKTYGDGCKERCGRCKGSGPCNVTNGVCQECDGNFQLPSCKECKDGFYGAGCADKCGMCKNTTIKCDKTTGHCPGEMCETGYQSPLCNETCTNQMYGDNCSLKCGRCESPAGCNAFNGTCLACEGNFVAPFCKECKDGYHGDECTECGQCKDNAACAKDTGHCPDGCKPGYQQANCKSKCKNGYHGNNCSKLCGQCLDDGCDHSHGSCSLRGCQSGFEPPLCISETPNGPDLAVIVGSAVAALVAVVVLAVVAFFLVKRRRSSNGGSKTTTGHQLTDLTSHDTGAPTRPTAVVQPSTQLITNGQDSAGDQHLYGNIPAASHPSASQRPASQRHAGSQRPAVRPQRPGAEEADAWTRAKAAEEEDENLGEEDDEGPVYGNAGNVYTTLRATKPDHDAFQTYLVDRLASTDLPAEFRTISKIDGSLSTDAGKMTTNKKKNRFPAIIPYDQSRVTLTDGYSADESTDYVNASYVKGHEVQGGPKYIAAQGPKDNTVADFWRLVWQEKVTHIVMLTNVQEKGRSKCYQYWPKEGSSVTWGPVTVTTTGIELRGYFYIRTLSVKRDKVSREVTQYHYVSWPDHGVPTTTSLVRFWRDVSSKTRDDHAPLLVHCSAGVGRTGTYIGLDIGMKTAVRDGKCNVLDLVKRMRRERTLMVQAVEQYGFLYEALLEAYTARDTLLTTDQFDVIFPDTVSADTRNTRIDAEFKALVQMQPLSCEKSRKTAAEEVNMAKNRNSSTLPFDEHLVYLTEHIAGRNQYIHAVYMPTFRDPKGSILTQLPLPSTLVDFWRLVYGNGVTTIISLCSPNEEREVTPYCHYYPREMTDPVATGPYTVSLTSKTTDRSSLSSYTLQLQKTGESSPRSVRVLHYEGWTGEEGGHCADMMTLLDAALSSSPDGNSPPLLIQCSDGVSKSGLFSALCDIINHMTYDRQCDVYMAVRHVQTVSPNAVTSLAQYRYCYQIAQQRHRDTSVYANT